MKKTEQQATANRIYTEDYESKLVSLYLQQREIEEKINQLKQEISDNLLTDGTTKVYGEFSRIIRIPFITYSRLDTAKLKEQRPDVYESYKIEAHRSQSISLTVFD